MSGTANAESDGPRARVVLATVSDIGQRIDNYLIKQLKGVPRTRIYRALRKGEVRVNGSRKKPTYVICTGDQIRIPPIRHSAEGEPPVIPARLLDHVPVLFEDDQLLVVDKPSGLAVHGGSGMDFGLIEALRQLRPELEFIELVHRLDRETSGCLMLAKTRTALVAMQQQLSEDRSIKKHYLALLAGKPAWRALDVREPLRQSRQGDGKKRVSVDPTGQTAFTRFNWRQEFDAAVLVEAELHTGRMHQARVHAASTGYPIAGDKVYGDHGFNQWSQKLGLGRLFLHAERLRIQHPVSGHQQDFFAALPASLKDVLDQL